MRRAVPPAIIGDMPSATAVHHPFPAAVRLVPHTTVLHRGPAGRMIGLNPGTALAVDDLPEPLAAMIDDLGTTVPVADLLARAVRRGATADQAETLLRELLDTGAVVDANGTLRRAARRADATVLVVGGGPIGSGVVTGLVHAGIGEVRLAANGTVGADDLGTGLVAADRGRPRAEAVLDAARRLQPGAKCTKDGPATARRPPDLLVLTDTLAAHPVRTAALHAERVTHLPVRLRDGIGVVGPLVLPGRSACLRCLDRHRRDRDPMWPTVAAQLVDRPGSGEPAAVAAVAALGTAQALVALDEPAASPPTLGATLELDVTGGTLVRRRWSARTDCGCGALAGRPVPDVTCTNRTRRETIMM